MSGVHAPLAFSFAPIWVECPGSVQLSQGVPPEPDTDETLEGNAADWVAKQYAAGNEVAYGSPTPIAGHPVDYDMIHGAKLWRDAIGYGAISGMPVVSTRIHPVHAWGEPDGWTWEPIARRVKLPDYKYGFEMREPNSWQNIGYVASVLEALDLLSDPDVEAWLGIVQPRAWHKDGPVRWWKTTVGELRAYINIMRDAAMRALPWEGSGLVGVTPPTKAGPHCFHCPARHHCKTLQAAAGAIAEWSGTADRNAMSPADIGTELAILTAAAKLLEARRDGLHAQVDQMVRRKERVPGWRLEVKPGRLKWNEGVTPAQVLAMGEQSGKDMRKPHSLTQTIVTPTQAIAAGMDAATIKALASSPDTFKLVQDDGSDARRVFG